MARVFLIVAVVGVLVSGIFGFLINGKKKEEAAARQQAEVQTKTAQDQFRKASNDLKTAKDDLTATQSKLEAATKEAQAVQADLSAAQKKAEDLQAQLAAAQEKATTAAAQLKEAQAQAGAQSDAAKAAQAQVADLDKQKRILQDQLAKADAEVKRLTDVVQRTASLTMPPGISGKIVSVNRNWNFVVLNIGNKDGLVDRGELIVSRNKQVVGRIRVVSTEANTAVADILVNTLQGQIQPGDDVLN